MRFRFKFSYSVSEEEVVKFIAESKSVSESLNWYEKNGTSYREKTVL